MFQKPEELRASIHELGVSVWTAAAIAALFESGLGDVLRAPRSLEQLAPHCPGLTPDQLRGCLELAAAAGVVRSDGASYALCDAALPFTREPLRAGLQGELRTNLLQALALLDAAKDAAPRPGWRHTDPALLQSQGDASAGLATALKQRIVPQLPELAQRLERSGARCLDVGVGVAALAIALCREYPSLQVVGLDVHDPALALAGDNITRAELGARIELRRCPVQELDDALGFDLAWLPSFFVPRAELAAALARVRAALRPGGWLVFAAAGDPAGRLAASRGLVVALWGGADLGSEEACGLLAAAGFSDVRVLPGPSWAPALLAARAG